MSNTRVVAWAVWVIASIFYAYQYILRVMPSIMLNDIMQQFNIDAAIFGQFSGVYYLGYSLMHLPIGIMLDKYGPRRVMTGCILLTVVGTLPIIFTEHWLYPIAGRFLIGIGSSAAILGVFKIIRMNFKESLFPRMLSFSVTIGLIGAIYGSGPVGYMCSNLGYKMVVEIFAFIGLALALVTYLIVPNMENIHKATVISDIKQVLSNKRAMLTCLFAGLMVGPIEGFADVWGSEFFKQVYGFNLDVASSLPSLIFIGMCFGAPALNFVAERSKSYLGTIIGAGLVMTFAFIALVTKILDVNSVAMSLTLVGVCCAYQILAIYKATSYVSKEVVGITTAMANMFIMIFGYGFHSSIGYIIKINADTSLANAFTYGVYVIPVTLVIGSLGFMLLAFDDRRRKIMP